MKQFYNIGPGMNVAVVGFGRAGQAMSRYIVQKGASLLVSDNRSRSGLAPAEQALLESCSARYEGGEHRLEFLKDADMLIVSPGVPAEHPVFRRISDKGVPVIGELAVAADQFQAPVIAISGTNGKTTVTELVSALLADSGKHVFTGGNIGTPIGEYLLAPSGFDVIVLEVSSFQLETCGCFAPDVGVLLNITPDHLDRHKTLEAYAAAKMRLFGKMKKGVSVINGDDLLCRKFIHLAAAHSFRRFGKDPEYEAIIDDQTIQVKRSGQKTERYDLSGSALATVSGCLNSAAALLAVQPFGIVHRAAQHTLRTFATGAHRVEVVDEINGVVYINDSKATNTGAVISALEQVGGRVILIAGGKDKGDDYRLLRDSVRSYVKQLILLGENEAALTGALGDVIPCRSASDMNEAVQIAAGLAVSGDTVLLSPASASFDMFDNYIHRGMVFSEAVGKIKVTTMGLVQ